MSYPPLHDGVNMNETNTRNRAGKLELLPAEMQAGIIEIAANSRLVDALEALKEHGVEVDVSTLSRFIKKHHAKNIVNDGKEMKAEVEALAERGKDGKFREGTLEAVRQRLYERALESQTAEEALALYGAMVKEETRLKELELEARKVAALEQQVRLQGLRIQVLAQGNGGKGRVKAELASSEPMDEKGMAVAQLTEGEAKQELGGPSGAAVAEAEREKLLAILREVDAEINRGGPPEEKVMAVRGVMKRERS